MSDRTRLTSVDAVREDGSWLFTTRDGFDNPEEVILVPCDDGVEAWVNRCTHENQRLDRGFGAAIRDGEIVCPKHGSMFDGCSGECDNGDAAGTRLVSVDVAVDADDVYLTDRHHTFSHEGGIDADDEGDGPASSSHLSF